MAWDFSTEPEFQTKLDWMREFIRDRIWPLEVLSLSDAELMDRMAELQSEVKRQGLWAAHLDPELGGQGFGQLKLALMHELIGTSPHLASLAFGNQAPDSGNAEILALAGNADQKRRWLEPLLQGDLKSAFAMTEPEVAGSDPTLLRTAARRDGDGWVIDGHKWFSSNAGSADFLLVMARSEPAAEPHRSFSVFIVPTSTPGVRIVRNVGTMEEPEHPLGEYGGHAEIRFEAVRVGDDALLGERGGGFVLAQKRLGPGRIHHVMRWIGQCNRAFDMMCERAVSREAFGGRLADKQTIQNWVAESAVEIRALRILTLQTAWRIDREGTSAVRAEISMLKFYGARVLNEVIDRALQVHGSLGFSVDMPLERMFRSARGVRFYDGPDELHKSVAARLLMKEYRPVDVPTEHIPTRRRSAEAQRELG